jgi:5,10-methylene-tetrahydrofolate dehydrogenase/methenyl tetrahydrofolate cyclohydrolase
MVAQLIDGKAIAQKVRDEVKADVERFVRDHGQGVRGSRFV